MVGSWHHKLSNDSQSHGECLFFGFPRLLTQAALRAFLFVDQELHLIEILSLTPGDAYQAEFEFPG